MLFLCRRYSQDWISVSVLRNALRRWVLQLSCGVHQQCLICKNQSFQCGSAQHTVLGDACGTAFMVALSCQQGSGLLQRMLPGCHQLPLVMLAGNYS